MPEDGSKFAAAAIAAVGLAHAHGDELVGGTRRDLLDRGAALLSEVAATGRVLPMAAAWRFGAAHHYRGEYPAALAFFEAAVADPDAGPVDRARFLSGYASVLWAQGNAEPGRRVADESMAAAQASGDDGAIGAAWVAHGLVQAHAGDRSANLHAYEKALAHAELAGDAITVVRVRNNLGSRHVEAGRFRQALEELDHAVAVSEDHSVGLASAMVSINRAEALLGLGRLEEAVGEIAIATDQFRGAEAEHLLAFALLLEADTHRVRGNATRAHAKYREAVERAEASGNAQVLGPAFAGLAETTVADDPANARAHAKRAVDQPHTVGDVIALRAAGWIALGQDDLEAAEMWANRALEEAGRRDQLCELADALELRALTRWSSTGDAREALSSSPRPPTRGAKPAGRSGARSTGSSPLACPATAAPRRPAGRRSRRSASGPMPIGSRVRSTCWARPPPPRSRSARSAPSRSPWRALRSLRPSGRRARAGSWCRCSRRGAAGP